VGKPFGPFVTSGRGRQRRQELDEIGHEIMRQIATVIPAEQHGVYASDPKLRAEAEAVADYPYHDLYLKGK
jgi:hypothetical protein